MHILTTMYLVFKSCHYHIMHMLMQSASLIVTPLRTSICKPMN